MIDVNLFGQWMVDRLALLKAAGLEHASWTTVYDGDELESCNVHLNIAGGAAISMTDARFRGMDLDEVLVHLAKSNVIDDIDADETGSWILNLETGKAYHTSRAWREMKIVEQPYAQPEETDLSGLDLRTQAEKDY